MTTTASIATKLEQWAAATLSINTIEHAPNSIAENFPFVICEIQRKARSNRAPELPGIGGYQQTYLSLWTADLLIMVNPEPTWTASQALYGYVDALGDAVLRDETLGGRVHTASKTYEASFSPPELQYQDGTVARVATFTIVIGEVTEV